MRILLTACLGAFLASSLALRADSEPGFQPLFDGQTLNGWSEMHKTKGPPYFVTNGVIVSPPDSGNDLVTDAEFSNFILRLEFKLTPGANNGIGLRVPMETNDLTYAGNEVQILDDSAPQYAQLEPGQYCGSLYKIFAAKRGAVKPPGEWNDYEITANGPRIKVILNGQTIAEGNLNDVKDRETRRVHYGMSRPRGHLALLGHFSRVEFRHLRVRSLPPDSRPAPSYTPPLAGHFVLTNFTFRSGEVLPSLRMNYLAFGAVRRDADCHVTNAVIVLHGTTGNGGNFVRPEFAGELFGPGQLLDADRYYIVLIDSIGHGRSSKPSDGLHAHFPRYGYRDMVEAQYRLVTEGLGVDHARLVMGTSMGGMHTWLWGETHPLFMDALLPLASLPTQISGRNRVWRRMIIDSIRGDPAWENGEYKAQPPGLRVAAETLYFMGSNPILRWKEAPTLHQADTQLDNYVNALLKTADANDTLYALEASQDYDPGPDLEKIEAPLLAVNSADDLINPPELGILEREIHRVKKGRAVVLPLSDRTQGHGSHTVAALWKDYLAQLLAESAH